MSDELGRAEMGSHQARRQSNGIIKSGGAAGGGGGLRADFLAAMRGHGVRDVGVVLDTRVAADVRPGRGASTAGESFCSDIHSTISVTPNFARFGKGDTLKRPPAGPLL